MTAPSKILIVFVLIATFLTACSSKIPVSTIKPSDTSLPGATATTLPTGTNTATATRMPTNTAPPTSTRTLRPSSTPTPDIRPLLSQAVQEAGIIFPEELSAAYEDDSQRYGGSIHLSQALAQAGGFSSVEISDEMMRRILLDTLGHAAYASLYNHKRYDDFQALVPSGDNNYQFMVTPLYIRLAERYVEESTFQFIVNSSVYPEFERKTGSFNVTITHIHIHFIKMAEYPALKEAFDSLGILVFDAFPGDWTKRREAAGDQQRGLLVLSGSSLHVFGYDNGNNLHAATAGFYPLEQLGGSSDLKRLKAFEELVGFVEWWISLMFSSQVHPNFLSIFTTISMEALCADSLENLDQYQAWLTACNPTAEGMLK